MRQALTLKQAAKRAMTPLSRLLTPAATDLPIEQWDLRADGAGRLRYAGHDLLALAAQYGTPLQLLNVARLDANLAAFGAEGAGRGLPELFYSFKTQPLPWIVRRLLQQGAGAEVISEHELRLALHLGASPDRIVFNGPAKTDAALRLAIGSDILLLNLNHPEEIERIAAAARALGRRARVGVRVNTRAGWCAQFGCSIASGEALVAFQRALQTPELDVIGLHSHRGGQMHHAEALDDFLGELLDFAAVLHERLDFVPQIIDVGGSLGIPTVRPLTPLDKRLGQSLHTAVGPGDPSQNLSPAAYAQRVTAAVRSHFASHRAAMPRLIIEPGRALVGNAQALLATVVETRASADGIDYAILDAGINIAGILREEHHQLFRVTGFGAPAARFYRIVGPICQPGDVIYDCVRLPELARGDVLVIMDSGAYCEPDSTSFSFLRPATVALEAGRDTIIRRAESLDDALQRDSY